MFFFVPAAPAVAFLALVVAVPATVVVVAAAVVFPASVVVVVVSLSPVALAPTVTARPTYAVTPY